LEPKPYDTGSSKAIIKPGKDAIVSDLTGSFWWCCGSVLTLDSLPASSHVETQQN
jgi:hypothetical protein